MPSPSALPVLRAAPTQRVEPGEAATQHLRLATPPRVPQRGFSVLERAHADAHFNETHSRCVRALRQTQNAMLLNVDLADRVTSEKLIKAVAALDLGQLKARRIDAVATFDLDGTLMANEVLVEFAELAAAKRAFPEAGKGALVAMFLELGLRTVARPQLERASVNELMVLANQLAQARASGAPAEESISTSEHFFLFGAAVKGMHVPDAYRLAEELFEQGAPGRTPYKTRLFESSPAPGHGARELVAACERAGLKCYIVTAGMRFLAQVAARYVGIPSEQVLGSELETERRYFTGRIVDAVDMGKPALIRRHIGTPPLFAFGDTPRTDLGMLKMALLRGFMVNPGESFQRVNRAEGNRFTALTYGATGTAG